MYPLKSIVSTSRTWLPLRSIASALFSLVLISSVFFSTATNAFAASIDDLTFSLINEDTEYAVTDCDTDASGELAIPATYNGKPVTQIGAYAFYYCNLLTSISIPQGVTEIGDNAFQFCWKLTSINLPLGLTEIGDSAFYGCTNLTSISIPEGVTDIRSHAFFECIDMKTVTLPENVTIWNNAFARCSSLTRITIPKGVTIRSYVFGSCSSLTRVTILGGFWVGTDIFWDCTDLEAVYFAGPPPYVFDATVFRNISADLTLHVSEEDLASYEALNLGYPLATYLPGLFDGSIRYSVSSRYDAENLRFSLVSKNEDNRLNTLVQYTDDLASDQWTTLSSLSYLEATSSADNTVTRTLSNVDPAVTPGRFYRLHSDL